MCGTLGNSVRDDSVGSGTLEWDSGSDQRPISRSPEDPPECSRDSLFSELCPVGPSQSSRLVREALPNVENVPTFITRPLATISCCYIEGRGRAKDAGDDVGEERAWKVVGLITMLLHRSKRTGSL